MLLKGIFRALLIVTGTLFVILGIIGIFIPVLPTTPFLLLAAACYARSSERFYNGLLSNRIFGNYIRNYREGKGVPVKVKMITILFLWSAIIFSITIASSDTIIRIVLIIIAVLVTVHVALIGKRKNEIFTRCSFFEHTIYKDPSLHLTAIISYSLL